MADKAHSMNSTKPHTHTVSTVGLIAMKMLSMASSDPKYRSA